MLMWTDEKVKILKELWGKGKTASQIAEIIGGISRNAVIGKAHRLNLSEKLKGKNFRENRSNLDPNDNRLQNNNHGKKKIY